MNFWMVWNSQGHRPRQKHETYESAAEEAERIARRHPGAEVYVLAPVSMAQTVPPPPPELPPPSPVRWVMFGFAREKEPATV